jgi:hypothetical protein
VAAVVVVVKVVASPLRVVAMAEKVLLLLKAH